MDGSPLEGTWFYGNGVLQGENKSIIYQSENGFDKHVVYSDTVGQYTGLTDMNGNKIFEGDIVKNIITGEKGVIQWFDERSAFMMWSRTKNAIYFLYDKTFSNIRIVGNVFDNPELLRGDANG